MAHATDFDDTHHGDTKHPSDPCWSTPLTLDQAQNLTGQQVLAAFITGYEIIARLGGGGTQGITRNLQLRGFHPTTIAGLAGATEVAACATMLELSE